MQIHTNLSTDSAALAAFQNQRPAAASSTTQTPAPAASETDASAPVQTQDDGWEIQDTHGADQMMDSLRQSMMSQPSSMTLLHGQSLSHALGLLQSGQD